MAKEDAIKETLNQCRKPTGAEGKKIVFRMNESHSEITDWGLKMVSIPREGALLDAGCGGGRTLEKLAMASSFGKIFGIDYSEDCVEWAKNYNQKRIDEGKMVIPSPEKLTKWLMKAGFQNVRIKLEEKKNWLCCIAQ
ncbi:Methyltransferase domain-containing protein [Tindallia magadiensis]|uniref:Methyltransferase domain-containing protein n=1 Tax=Tindallia magadiensis TaxID=69895 RepID=A0A1I3GRC5_9FIRM|nr:class I SAM-dependent methyltransferase [Tindallia magadiensis]SFI25946.1 Methyltransferase domain-containing protein [Tindallia magadiensis]